MEGNELDTDCLQTAMVAVLTPVAHDTLVDSQCVSGDISKLKLDMHGMECAKGASAALTAHDDVTCPISKLGTDHDILELINKGKGQERAGKIKAIENK